ncbi:hypothetical protein [Chitinophaga qingshengii]|uniref:DUF4595 domain-containing protein n=1 Tax=Chitinophaga qingshengii TaxID=1569794 RepID=A0ABR7TNT4_9BACT|nr:hypothetical protein [Chitinophaga qingshengii]MBC9932135.1 hypothetical protein [Chitinophaga qingshengii]
MKKQLLALASAALLFAACSKKDNAKPEEVSFTGLLKTMYSKIDTSVFEYNNDKTLSKWSSAYTDKTDVGGDVQTIVYANGKVSQIWLASYAEDRKLSASTLNMEMVYANDGKLQKIIGYDADDKDNVYEMLVYNNAGKLEKVLHYSGPKGGEAVNTQVELITWTGNNITKVVHQYISGTTVTEETDEYTFDDKENYMSGAGLGGMVDMFTPEVFNANNITKMTSKRVNYPDNVTTYTFEYAGAKPVKMTRVENAGTTSERNDVFTLEYYK